MAELLIVTLALKVIAPNALRARYPLSYIELRIWRRNDVRGSPEATGPLIDVVEQKLSRSFDGGVARK